MIEVHLKVETLAELSAELQRVLGPLLAAQGVTLPEAPKRGRPRKDSVPAAEQAAEPPEAASAALMSREEAPAPVPEAETPPTVGEMRALLARFQATHPLGVAAVINLLQEHGGAKRLVDCSPETWPVIAAAIEHYLARGEAA